MILIALAIAIGLPMAAIAGVAYRGLYAAGAIAGLIAGVILVLLTPGPAEVMRAKASGEKNEAVGAKFMADHFPNLASVAFAGALGGFIGAVAYRAKRPA